MKAVLVYLGVWALGFAVGALFSWETALVGGMSALVVLGSLSLATVTDSMGGTLGGGALGLAFCLGLGFLAPHLQPLGVPPIGWALFATIGCCYSHFMFGPRITLLNWIILTVWVVALAVLSATCDPRHTFLQVVALVVVSLVLMLPLTALAGRLVDRKGSAPKEGLDINEV